MSTRRRSKAPRSAATAVAPVAVQSPARHTPVVGGATRLTAPTYRWRQFPVYFALVLGLFIGLELGLVAGWLESSLLTTIFSVGVAILLGFGIARLVVVWMVSRNWVKPRPRRRR